MIVILLVNFKGSDFFIIFKLIIKFQLILTYEMENQNNSEVKRKREQFSVAIRKQKKQEIFHSLRSKLKNSFVEDEQEKMSHFLDTPEKRNQWIGRRAKDLTGEPNEMWLYIINELLCSVLCFKGKGCFKIWIQSNIIKNLCSTFYSDYLELGLASQAAKLLANITFLEQEQQQQKTSLVALQILQQDIIQNMINLSMDPRSTNSEISQFVNLMINLTLTDYGPVIKNGGFTAVCEWSIRILKQKKINRAYLQQIYDFIKIVAEHLKKTSTKYSFANLSIKLINQFIEIDQATSLLEKVISILQIIISQKKQPIYACFLQFKPLTRKILQLSVHENQSIRKKCWSILSFLSSSTKSTLHVFEQNIILDRIVQAYEKQPKDTANFDRITSLMLLVVGNIAEEGDYMRQLILKSKVISIVLDSTHQQRSTNLRKDAFYALYNIINTQNYDIFNIIVFKQPILKILVIGLESMYPIDAKTTTDILQALKNLITVDRNLYRNNEGVLQILESKYNLQRLLQITLRKHSKNVYACHIIDQIYDFYGN